MIGIVVHHQLVVEEQRTVDVREKQDNLLLGAGILGLRDVGLDIRDAERFPGRSAGVLEPGGAAIAWGRCQKSGSHG